MLFLLACTESPYDVADLQLDVDAAVPENTELARTCVTGVGYREEGAGVGRLATPGIPEALEQVEVQVDLFDDEGVLLLRTAPATLSLTTPYVVTGVVEVSPDALPCDPEGEFARENDPSLLLTVRFLQAPW